MVPRFRKNGSAERIKFSKAVTRILSFLPPFPPLRQKPAPLSPKEVEHGIQITLVEGVVSTAFSILIGGTFFNAFALKLGVNAGQLGLLASLVPLSTLVQLSYPWFQRKIHSRRRLLLAIVVPDRFLLWGVIFIPICLPQPWWIPVLLGVIFVRSLAAQLDNLIYQDWLADLIPIDQRNSYWGLRHTLGGPVGIVIPFFAGWVLDHWGGFTGFKILYFIALPLIVADILLFLYQDEPPRQSQGPTDWKSLLSSLQVKKFRGYLFFFGLWTIFQGALTPYTSYVMFKVYHLPFVLVSGLTVLSTVTSTILYVTWGKTQDKYGVFSVYRFVLPCIAVVSGLWAFVSAKSYFLYFLLFIITGALNAATLVGSFSLMLTVIPVEDRSIFLTVNSVSLGIAGFLAPNLGAYILDLFEWWKPNLFSLNISPLRYLFLLGSIGSLFLALAFHKFVKPLR